MIFYKCLKAVMRVIFIPLFRVKFIGRERLPKEGGYILYANHMSNFDPVFMHLALNIKPRFIAKKELFKNPILSWMVTGLGAFPVERGKGDMGAFKNAFQVVHDGGVLGIFPEGTRAKDGVMKRFQPGAAMIAARTGGAVVPVFISGKFKAFKKTYMVFGSQIDIKEEFPEFELSNTESVRAASEYMAEALVKLKEEVPV